MDKPAEGRKNPFSIGRVNRWKFVVSYYGVRIKRFEGMNGKRQFRRALLEWARASGFYLWDMKRAFRDMTDFKEESYISDKPLYPDVLVTVKKPIDPVEEPPAVESPTVIEVEEPAEMQVPPPESPAQAAELAA